MIKIILGGRNTGKTTAAVSTLLNTKNKKIYYFSIYPDALKPMGVDSDFIKKNCISYSLNNLMMRMIGRSADIIILDDFFFCKSYDKIFDLLMAHLNTNGTVYLYSSFNDIFDNYKWLKNKELHKQIIPLDSDYINNQLVINGKVTQCPKIVIDELMEKIG